MRLAIVGVGAFSQEFIPLFQAHPSVDSLVFVDTNEKKLASNASEWGVGETYGSLDAVLESDVDAVALFTQNWLHAPQAVSVLEAGKHVYSAVPTGITVDEVVALVDAVGRTGKHYMLGETSYYYPGVLFSREKYRAGEFGDMVYAEGHYYHDMDHGLYDVFKWRGGDDWKKYASMPPMLYPTHSVSQVLSVIDGYMTHVSCQGWMDNVDTDIFDVDRSPWRNTFSNESALFRTSVGGSARINEFRRVGHPGAEESNFFGTLASFELNRAGAAFVTKDVEETEIVTEQVTCVDREDDRGVFTGVAPVHPIERLPAEFAGLKNGHWGSHQFLVDDFVSSVVSGKRPTIDVWKAARYVLPGILAHESAMHGGELLEVPDLGDGGK